MKIVQSRPLFLAIIVMATSLFFASPVKAEQARSGYWMLDMSGRVYPFGAAIHIGNAAVPSDEIAVHIAPMPKGNGYYILDSAGKVYAFGDASWGGDAKYRLAPDEIAVSISVLPGEFWGYWIFTDKGRVFAFAEARHFGDMAGITLNGPVLDSVATASGNGYWMVASDGGVFSFGDAKFYGSMGHTTLNEPVMSLAPDPDGTGYWLVAADGGIFAFDATFYGSTGSIRLNEPISGIVGEPGGYMMVARDGGIFAFGHTQFHGSLGANPPPVPVISVGTIRLPDAVYQQTNLLEVGGTGSDIAGYFDLHVDRPAVMGYSCGYASGFSAGCIIEVRRFDTGVLLDYVSPGAGQSGSLILHPDERGTYYVEVSEYSVTDDTQWGVAVTQEQCVANCT